MGTSVKMIEDYYGKHATTTSRAAKLGGDAADYRRLPTFFSLRQGRNAVCRDWSKELKQRVTHPDSRGPGFYLMQDR
jgi:hypothetical protein